MEDTAEKWKQQALQSLIKRMVAAAMREYYRGPEAAEKWAGMKETLEQAFKTREITDFSIEVDAQGCPTQIVLGTICRDRKSVV